MTKSPVSQAEKGKSFRALHKGKGVFVIPNPWDPGSARLLQALGFKALATTSAGYAETLGRLDGMVTLREKADHCAALTDATDIPISADAENGFGDDPKAVGRCIYALGGSGIVGASIEDFSGNPKAPLYDLNHAVERIEAAVQAAKELPFEFLITARAENLLRTNHDIDESIERLQAYAKAGADVVYAPGLKTLDQVQQVAKAVKKPLNVLGAMLPNCSVAEIGDAGAKRVSLGSALQRRLTATLLSSAQALMEQGDLSWAADGASNRQVQGLLADWLT